MPIPKFRIPGETDYGGRGCRCRKCGSVHTRVIRTSSRYNRIDRRRECIACGHRWATVERERAAESDPE